MPKHHLSYHHQHPHSLVPASAMCAARTGLSDDGTSRRLALSPAFCLLRGATDSSSTYLHVIADRSVCDRHVCLCVVRHRPRNAARTTSLTKLCEFSEAAPLLDTSTSPHLHSGTPRIHPAAPERWTGKDFSVSTSSGGHTRHTMDSSASDGVVCRVKALPSSNSLSYVTKICALHDGIDILPPGPPSTSLTRHIVKMEQWQQTASLGRRDGSLGVRQKSIKPA